MTVKKYFNEPRLPTDSVKEATSRSAGEYYLTVGKLKELSEKLSSVCDEDTLIVIERLKDSQFTDGSNGWKVINCLWDTYVDRSGVQHDSYCDGVPIINAVRTVDENGDTLILLTPHY